MRPIATILLAAACLTPTRAPAQDRYAAVLQQYSTGDADAALAALSALQATDVQAGVDAFSTARSLTLTAAAAMHTEAAIQRGGGFHDRFQLGIATAIVEFGERRVGKASNGTAPIHPQFAAPVSDDFRRLWYCAVISALEAAGLLPQADRYLDHALALFPDNPEVQMLAGVAAEMRASPRTALVAPADRRRALEQAERYYRFTTTAEPDRLEARLRLGRVLQMRGKDEDARGLLAPLTTSTDDRLAYLACLFLAGVEDETQHAGAAIALYDRAAARLPSAQTARLAASELRHRGGDHLAAADAIAQAAGAGNTSDPWWTYVFGEYWRVDMLLTAIRSMRRA